MQQSSATPSLHLGFLGLRKIVACSQPYLAVASCIYSFWHGVIPTSYFIFNDFYTCIHVGARVLRITYTCTFAHDSTYTHTSVICIHDRSSFVILLSHTRSRSPIMLSIHVHLPPFNMTAHIHTSMICTFGDQSFVIPISVCM